MCLLVHQPKTTKFSDDFLADVFLSNRDGFGVMYAEAGRLEVARFLPETADEFIALYRAHADGRECIWHARMQTHGVIDIGNCHPDTVTPRIALAHNGILATGNSWDEDRSDTWHFIRNVIEPVVAHDEARILDPVWQAFIGQLIGSSNKFGIMNSDGVAVIINRSSGVEFAGAWLSNTYAWSASKFGIGSRVASTRIWDWQDAYGHGSTYSSSTPRSGSSFGNGDSISKVYRAARNCYIRGTLARWVMDAPRKAAQLLNEIEQDTTGATGAIVWDDPDVAIEWIADYFDRVDGHPSTDREDRSDDWLAAAVD
jgi:hypothetical protein